MLRRNQNISDFEQPSNKSVFNIFPEDLGICLVLNLNSRRCCWHFTNNHGSLAEAKEFRYCAANDVLKYASDFSTRGCVLHNARGRAIGPSLSLPGRFWSILRPWQDAPKHKNVGGVHQTASLMHPQAINKHLISAHAIVSCTMIVGGRLGKV